ncbi:MULTISPECIES: F0F1 ATP synthase subunit gamma [Fructobacillus]|jgi:F-type H+-transporting ATPase subunit gamma|uniref:ATP synthase gamma chain n=1 Tax=Fructobacillus cardui TaxID=2893170 RepID=A0ABM9MYH7_9LACO|nr:F0F1 ATP synthase subunit gamma [Fructobacillus sp. EFB-N1]KMK53191.1 ATP synthase gamma chain [Fructobacillus sp. EFB-N1]CAK1221650.1 FoF1-type ATP synthase [Fructobacillus cardui]CAK1249229.1 FoF1-type ATP synthase [Fructobacillus cardui]CAK1250318.1 FoF1-type ATP synthase [Fructobacillus cardui]
MASLQDIKRRIGSTKKTRQITAAMQLVSTAKLSKIQNSATGYHEYANRLKAVVGHLIEAHVLDNVDSAHLPMVAKRPVKKTGILLVTSDRGLVGSYNANIIKETNALMEKHNLTKENTVILAIGGNGADFYKQRGFSIALEHRGISDVPTFNEIRQLLKTVISLYEAEAFDSLHLVYNHFVNRLESEQRNTQLLPLTKDILEDMDDSHEHVAADFEVQSAYDSEPNSTAVLNVVLPQYIQSLVFEAVLDAKTAEHAASSTAMSSATDSADDLIGTLGLQYNRARQAQITTEITEITGGLVALE